MDGGAGDLITLAVVSGFAAIAAVIVIVVVHLAGIGRLRRQRIAGIRTRTLLASDEAWVRGHRAATPVVWLTGSIAVLAALGAMAAAIGGSAAGSGVLLALAGVALLLGMALAVMRAHASV